MSEEQRPFEAAAKQPKGESFLSMILKGFGHCACVDRGGVPLHILQEIQEREAQQRLGSPHP